MEDFWSDDDLEIFEDFSFDGFDQTFCQENTAHLDTWTWSTMLGGHVQITLIGNAEVMELMWTLVSG